MTVLVSWRLLPAGVELARGIACDCDVVLLTVHAVTLGDLQVVRFDCDAVGAAMLEPTRGGSHWYDSEALTTEQRGDIERAVLRSVQANARATQGDSSMLSLLLN